MAHIADPEYHKRHRDTKEIGVQQANHIGQTPSIGPNQPGKHAYVRDMDTAISHLLPCELLRFQET
jgi:hypothetical protein